MMKKNLEEMLTTEGAAAQKTLVDAMVEWWMADDREDALNKIKAAPGEDLAGITNSVLAGLGDLANSLGVSLETLVSEENLGILAKATPEEIVSALNSIHLVWIEDNFNARRWAEKYFKGQLFQYRKTAKLPWEEVEKDLLFISEYLKAAGSVCATEEIKTAFEAYAANDAENNDLHQIAEKARSLAPAIMDSIKLFREKSIKKPAMVERIDAFLKEHGEPEEIMEIMLAAVVA